MLSYCYVGRYTEAPANCVRDQIGEGSNRVWSAFGKENANNITIAFKSEDLPYLKQRLIVVSDYFFLLLHNSV
jgi:hypothetical protein